MYLKWSGINLSKYVFTNELEKYTIIGAIDYELTKTLHRFKIEQEIEIGSFFDEKNGGFPKIISTDIICKGKCSARSTKDVPITLPLFFVIFFASGKILPKFEKDYRFREYFCNLLKTDDIFCQNVRTAWKDIPKYIKEHSDILLNAINNNILNI